MQLLYSIYVYRLLFLSHRDPWYGVPAYATFSQINARRVSKCCIYSLSRATMLRPPWCFHRIKDSSGFWQL